MAKVWLEGFPIRPVPITCVFWSAMETTEVSVTPINPVVLRSEEHDVVTAERRHHNAHSAGSNGWVKCCPQLRNVMRVHVSESACAEPPAHERAAHRVRSNAPLLLKHANQTYLHNPTIKSEGMVVGTNVNVKKSGGQRHTGPREPSRTFFHSRRQCYRCFPGF